ncbi:MAG TPA: pitrilysin family protein [Bacteroidia bacterium]|jgi:zinc protease|nr:pitrilysin family protein [Bacteroidia bacterium]
MPTEIMLDRITMPGLALESKINIIQATSHSLPNGVPVYYVNAGTQDVIKIEVIFRAGSREQDVPLVAGSTNSMLEEGTKKHTAEEIASLLDYYGSFLETSVQQDYASVTIYTLGKHIDKALPILEELIKEPSFPQNELEIYLHNNKQRFLVDEQKERVVAAKNFPSLLFGDTQPYGHKTRLEEYDGVKKEHLEAFHKKYYTPGNCAIIASGRVDEKLLNKIGDYFGKDTVGVQNFEPLRNYVPHSAKEKVNFIPSPKKDSVQSAIRMGRVMFLKTHADAIPFQILNTILGGYFGSRLMSNIREDKGYTYGISSSVIFLQHAGYFNIGSEVGSAVCEAAVIEIYKELERLCNEPVPADELQLVKNYLRGNFMRSMDGPFALADRFKHIWLHNMDYSYYEKYVNALSTITAKELMEMANKYLQKESIYELVVGKKK